MFEKELKVLEVINKNKRISQREISKEADLSIGKVNSTIRYFLEEEYIYLEKEGKGFSYMVTEKGIKALEENLKSLSYKKIVLHQDEKKVIKQAVILAAGERKEFGKPVAFLDIPENTIIGRSIDLLRESGIEDIIVVTGYESRFFEEIAEEKGLKLVKNNKYKWTGTMDSLALAKELIKDDFILIESDLVFEERALTEVLENHHRDCVLITNESGSGDEAFVEIRKGFLFKMSKDIHQLNRIDGEMIGISKISIEVYHKMLEEFKENKNPYLNYEYTLLDVGRNYDIGYVKIDDVVWSEIDTKAHYSNVIKYIYPKLKRRELETKVNNIKQYIVNALNVREEEIGDIIPAGGMTNKNYKVFIKDRDYVLRVPGTGTGEMINRKEEKKNSTIASKLGLDTKVLYFNEDSGIKIAEFIQNAETLNGKTAKKEENMVLITSILKKLHNSKVTFDNRFDVFEKIEYYELLLNKAKGKNFKDYFAVKERVMHLKKVLEGLKVELTACHNDTVPENFVKSGDDKVYLIDWEYSGMNDPMWDLAAHSLECDFEESDEELFLSKYFEGEVEEHFKKRILIYKICQDFLWSTWTNIKEAQGDDFGSYGIDRYNRAKKNLEVIYSMV